MKYKIIILAGTFGIALLSVQFVNQPELKSVSKDSVSFQYPAEVKAVIDNKCLGCHNPDARNEKSRNKLNFVMLPTMKKSEQVGKLGDIVDVTKKGEMPPKQFLEKKPEAKLTDSESELLIDWANNQADALMK